MKRYLAENFSWDAFVWAVRETHKALIGILALFLLGAWYVFMAISPVLVLYGLVRFRPLGVVLATPLA